MNLLLLATLGVITLEFMKLGASADRIETPARNRAVPVLDEVPASRAHGHPP